MEPNNPNFEDLLSSQKDNLKKSVFPEQGIYDENSFQSKNTPDTFQKISQSENPDLAPIRTYKADVAQAIQEKNASAVSVHLAEKKKQERESIENPNTESPLKTITIVALSILLIAMSAGAIMLYFYNQNKKNTAIVKVEQPKTIILFNTEEKIDTTKWTREEVSDLFSTKINEGLPANSVKDIKLTSLTENKISIRDLLQILEAKADAALVRSFDRDYMLGILSGDTNKPFLLIQTSLFDNAFSGMLVWEKTIESDLRPIFGNSQEIETSSDQQFQDLLILNRDTRALKNKEGKTVLLYSFLDNNTLLITEDEDAFKQIWDKFIAVKLIK